jgi:hypothetical protein
MGTAGSGGTSGTNGTAGTGGSSGSSGTSVSVSGVQNTIVKFASTTGITNSNITDDGTFIKIGSSISTNTQITGSFNVSSSLNAVSASVGVTGSFSISGSVDMNVVKTPISAPPATMSLDFSLGNYFTGSASGSFHISASNLRPGETGILKMNTAFAALPTLVATASVSSNVRQISGSAYTVTSGSNQTDILTFVALDATNIFLVASKKFI